MGTQTIREFTHSGGVSLGVDRESGVIRGVKILGLESRNGRTYLKETVARAAGLYEGAKVNVDHPGQKTNKPRSYMDRIGVIREVRLDAGDGGLRGDLHANPKHALFEQLAWDAENSPNCVGFSHDIVGKTITRGGKTVVEEITRVFSVDLVADPATTRGLFEQQVGDGEEAIEMASELATATAASLKLDFPGQVDEIIREALEDQANGEEAKAKDALIREQAEKIATLEQKAALETKRREIDAAIKEAKMPEALVTDNFRDVLLKAEDAAAVKEMIDSVMEVAKPTGQAPKSKEQTDEGGEYKQGTAKEFFDEAKRLGRGGSNG